MEAIRSSFDEEDYDPPLVGFRFRYMKMKIGVLANIFLLLLVLNFHPFSGRGYSWFV